MSNAKKFLVAALLASFAVGSFAAPKNHHRKPHRHHHHHHVVHHR